MHTQRLIFPSLYWILGRSYRSTFSVICQQDRIRSNSNDCKIATIGQIGNLSAWRRRQQERHKFAYLTMKNNSFARSPRALFIFGLFKDFLVSSMTWNHLFYSCVGNVSRWRQMLDSLFLLLKHCFQLNYRIIRPHFACVMTFNNWELIDQIGLLHAVPNSNSLGLKRSCLRNFHIIYIWMPNYNANTTFDDTILLVEPITSLHVYVLNLACYCPKSWSWPLVNQLSLGPRIVHFSWCSK